MSEDQGYIFTDRYGGNYPDPETVCQGQCEGMGVYPQGVNDPEATDYEKAAVVAALKLDPSGNENGWVFIKCPDCDGTGKRKDK